MCDMFMFIQAVRRLWPILSTRGDIRMKKLPDKSMSNARSAPRCLAKTRRGTECQCPAMRGKRRCRLHGGKATGAPKGNRNAWKHGMRSERYLAEIRMLREFARQARHMLD